MSYKINEFSKISGVPAFNLRFYEKEGYPQAQRDENGYRQYDLPDAYRINTFNMLIAQGFSVAEAIERLTGHEAEEYCHALRKNTETMEREIRLLQKKLEWNQKMQYVYSHLEYELSITRKIKLPSMYFLKCSEAENMELSMQNSEYISKWVDLLPASCYTQKVTEKEFALGMMIEQSIAAQYGLDTGELSEIPSGEYLCLLMNHDILYDRNAWKKEPRIAAYMKEGGKIELPVYSVYLMVEAAGYSKMLNYLLIRYHLVSNCDGNADQD
jgi:DNA-binding transcriptional MerR regulator